MVCLYSCGDWVRYIFPSKYSTAKRPVPPSVPVPMSFEVLISVKPSERRCSENAARIVACTLNIERIRGLRSEMARLSRIASRDSLSGSWFTGTGRSAAAAATTSSASARSSTPPGAFGLATTVPVARTTLSSVTPGFASSTTCAMPERSRTSTKQTLPRSRTRCTHPQRVASPPVRPESSAASVRIEAPPLVETLPVPRGEVKVLARLPLRSSPPRTIIEPGNTTTNHSRQGERPTMRTSRPVCRFGASLLVLLALCLALPASAAAADADAAAAAALWSAGLFKASPRQIAAAVAATHYTGTGTALVLFEGGRFSFADDGSLTKTSWLAFKILKEEAVRGWGRISIGWSPWHQDRPVVQARVVNEDGREYPLDTSSLIESAVGETNADTYSDRRKLEGPYPQIRVGSVVEVQITTVTRPIMDGAGIAARWWYGGDDLVIARPARDRNPGSDAPDRGRPGRGRSRPHGAQRRGTLGAGVPRHPRRAAPGGRAGPASRRAAGAGALFLDRPVVGAPGRRVRRDHRPDDRRESRRAPEGSGGRERPRRHRHQPRAVDQRTGAVHRPRAGRELHRPVFARRDPRARARGLQGQGEPARVTAAPGRLRCLGGPALERLGHGHTPRDPRRGLLQPRHRARGGQPRAVDRPDRGVEPRRCPAHVGPGALGAGGPAHGRGARADDERGTVLERQHGGARVLTEGHRPVRPHGDDRLRGRLRPVLPSASSLRGPARRRRPTSRAA